MNVCLGGSQITKIQDSLNIYRWSRVYGFQHFQELVVLAPTTNSNLFRAFQGLSRTKWGGIFISWHIKDPICQEKRLDLINELRAAERFAETATTVEEKRRAKGSGSPGVTMHALGVISTL